MSLSCLVPIYAKFCTQHQGSREAVGVQGLQVRKQGREQSRAWTQCTIMMTPRALQGWGHTMEGAQGHPGQQRHLWQTKKQRRTATCLSSGAPPHCTEPRPPTCSPDRSDFGISFSLEIPSQSFNQPCWAAEWDTTVGISWVHKPGVSGLGSQLSTISLCPWFPPLSNRDDTLCVD